MKKYLIIFLTGVVLAVLGVFGAMRYLSQDANYKFGLDRAAVIKQIQSLNRLETASFNIDKIIEAGTDGNKLTDFLFGDKILLVAHGEVIAGFDLSQLSDKSFEGDKQTISITLPAPQILSTKLDNSKTRVFDRKQGLFTKGELNLEAEAREQAESSIRAAACEGDILNVASENAVKQLEVLFKGAGFQTVIIRTTSAKCD